MLFAILQLTTTTSRTFRVMRPGMSANIERGIADIHDINAA